MKRILLYIISLIAIASCTPEAYVKKGDKALAIGEYFVAADYYRKAYSKTPASEHKLRGERALKMAQCYERFNSTTKALGGYRNAIRYEVATPEDHLHYGRLLLKNGEYKNALTVFEALSDSMPDNILVKNGLESARMAPQWKQEGSGYKIKKMDLFNSRKDDYSPVLGGEDFDRLYFTSTRNDAEGDDLNGVTGMKSADIFYSEKDDKGKWSKPEAISTGLNTDNDEGACCLTPDGKEMYLTQCGTDPSYPRYAKIVTSSRSDASWSAVKDFEISKDTLSSFAHPAISPDGEWLYFVSDMPGGKGGLDIWRTRLTSSGAMGVENLGEPINTPGNEMFPTFRYNGDLYFSSDGHPGMGGLDIFIATIGEDNEYHIEHPGFPLNSVGDDFGMTFEGIYNRGFFCSSRGDGRGYDHIYSFDNPEQLQIIQGWVYEQEGYELTNADVRIVGSDGTNERMGVKSDGSFEYVAEKGVDYIILATCNGYLNHKEELSIPKDKKESETYTLQFALANISSPVLIDNIFFEFDKSSLLKSSQAALDSLVMLLNENPNITIELGAHTDYKGPDEYNKMLSQRRAEQVVKYLISKGIAADRLTPVGYGEERPKKIRRKVAENYPWLKEGDVLTEEFISGLKPDEQATANALNRRTEFTVLRTTYDMFDENGNLKQMPKPRKQPVVEEGSDDDVFVFE
ncbi:MAG: OmpA family protein [Prevotella sp.]|nr:OmpA family protein [Candidatus Prevotella equi]